MKRCLYYAFLVLGILICKTGSAFDYSLVPVRNLQAQAFADLQSQGFTEGQALTLESEMAMAADEPAEPPGHIGHGNFFVNLGYNFKSIFSVTNLPPAMAGTVVSWSAHGFDHQVNDWVFRHRDSEWGTVGDFLGSPEFVIPVIGTLYVLGRHSDSKKFHSMTYSLVQGYILVTGIDYAIKFGTHRLRPDKSDHQSLPSGHAATSFMWAGVLSHYYGHKAAYPAYIAAAFISISRLQQNVHWVSDIFAGATVGYIIGNTVARKMDLVHPEGKFAYTVAPILDPHSHSVGMAMMINF